MAYTLEMPKKECVECGGGTVDHGFVYTTIVLDELMRPFVTPGPVSRTLARPVYALERRITPHLLDFVARIGLAKRQQDWDDKTLLLGMCIWEEAKARGIALYEWRLFGLARNVFVAQLPNGKKIAFEGIPFPPSGVNRVWWMDDKAELKKHFKKRGFPVADGGHASSEQAALRLFDRLSSPLIAKPHSGSASRHTTLHIDTPEKVRRAFRIGKEVSPKVVIEEELFGPVYRATVVDGVFAAALRRDPPHVVGDGVHSVEALVEEANKHPKRQGPYFSKMHIDDAAVEELAWQGLAADSVPEAGRRVTLHQKVNWSLGGTTADVTATVHPDNVRLFEEVSAALKAPIAGIDFIITDITRSWKEQERCGILECNSMPYFDNHHLPFEGEPQNVAARIWDAIS